MNAPTPILFARRSSHLSRVVFMVASEFELDLAYRHVPSLLSEDPEDYGGHPSLKVPVLLNEGQAHYGALNICRRLWGLAGRPIGVVWPEDLSSAVTANAIEIVLNGMGSEITVVMDRMARQAQAPKMSNSNAPQRPELSVPGPGSGLGQVKKALASLEGGLGWLEQNLPEVLEQLPERRTFSYLEICLHCFVEHVEWREVMSLRPYPRLLGFRTTYGSRAAAQATEYRMHVK